ncbi:MAG: 3-phosphoshikimate 1-carboxyvinyltransferase [Hyphomicrobiaceae bacterium]
MHHATPSPMRSARSGPLAGDVRLPGDKSLSHRALMFGALASGVTRVSGLLRSGDVLGTRDVLVALGVPIAEEGGEFVVHGRGVGGLVEPSGPLDFGNSGTGTRLMLGIIAGHDMTVTITGDASLSKRPMGRVLKPLSQMGLEVLEAGRTTLPMTVRGSARLRPIVYALDVPSAQVKSAVLLAGLHAPGETTVIEREATRDHTERMLRHFGASLRIEEKDGARHITVSGDAELRGRDVVVPGDPSSAAFLAAAAAIVPGSKVTIRGILANPTRTGFYLTLAEMGADLAFSNERTEGGEAVADLTVRAGPLTGVTVPAARAPSMIDEYPVLAAVAAFARGTTRMDGLAELKAKESDRLAATAAGLAAAGVRAEVEGDSLTVHGGDGRVEGGGLVETHLDHRIAMAFLTLGLASRQPMTVDDVGMIQTSFPEFVGLMTGLGARLEQLARTER